jgi:hypothetical protein
MVVLQFGLSTLRRHPERSRFSGEAKDLPLKRLGAQAKLHHHLPNSLTCFAHSR